MKQLLSNLVVNYLKFFAKLRLQSAKPKIIGVTGSVGKSTCVYLLDNVLSTHFRTKTTLHGNSETGLPLELLDLREKLSDFTVVNWLQILLYAPFQAFNRPEWELVIAEMGIDSPFKPKNMSFLLTILKPDISIFLNVAPVHTEQFMAVVDPHTDNLEAQLLEAIGQEKGLIVTTLTSKDHAIINTDYPQIKQLIPKIKANVISVGTKAQSNYQLIDYKIDKSGTTFVCKTPDGKVEIRIAGQLLFKEFAPIILSVVAASNISGISTEDVVQTIKSKITLPPGRQTILNGLKNSTIIDSSYNSSPHALEAHLGLLRDLSTRGQKIVCLGDMNELGELSAPEHQRLAKVAAASADVVILVGKQMFKYGLPAIQETKFPKSKLFVFLTADGIGKFIAENYLSDSDLILLKGSQNGIYLEQVAKELLADPASASQVLCRQSPFWEKKRRTFFKEYPNQQLFAAS